VISGQYSIGCFSRQRWGLVRHNFRPGFLDKMIREAALMCMTPRLAEIRPLLSQFICPFHGYFLDSDKARPVRTTCSLSETSHLTQAYHLGRSPETCTVTANGSPLKNDDWAWFETGLFWVTQTIGLLLPSEGGLDAEMKKTGRVSNRFRVQLKELKPCEAQEFVPRCATLMDRSLALLR